MISGAIGLTIRQAELLGFVERYIASHQGASPSFAEIAAALGGLAQSGVHRMVHILIERGHLTMKEGSHRSIAPVHRSAGLPKPSNDASPNMHRCSEIRAMLRGCYASAHQDRCEAVTDDALHQIAVAAVAWGDNAQVARRLRSLATALNLAATALARPVAVEG